MYRMEIAFDEEKIEREGEYDLAKMWAMVEDCMLGRFKLKKYGYGVYGGYRNHENDGFEGLMVFAARFESYNWFLYNLKQWDWVEIDDDEQIEVYREDWKTPKMKRNLSS